MYISLMYLRHFFVFWIAIELGGNMRKTKIFLKKSSFWLLIELDWKCFSIFQKFRHNHIKMPLAFYFHYSNIKLKHLDTMKQGRICGWEVTKHCRPCNISSKMKLKNIVFFVTIQIVVNILNHWFYNLICKLHLNKFATKKKIINVSTQFLIRLCFSLSNFKYPNYLSGLS